MPMMKIRNIVLVIALLSPVLLFSQAPQGFAKATDTEGIKNQIRMSAENTNSISADFKQEKHLTMMEEVLVSDGRFLFRKKNNVKWEYVEPIQYAIIIRENRFIINNDGKVSEYDTESNKLFKEINNMIVMAIQGDFVDDANFNASFYEDEKYLLAILKPQNEMLENILTDIEIYFSKKDLGVAKVRFIEPGDDYTKISFSNRKVNISIDEDQFKVN